MKKAIISSSTIVNSMMLAQILGISDRRVRQLVDEGVINNVGWGKYELIKSVQQYCNFIRRKRK